ncbi:MAG: hypothetical protein C0425_02835 [Chlorobiaceae bacterium]|nr:hypothetical protein [Chlorobiaceae bacterium]MBA4309256.1 hypothetical protein [Chlorobiaceae bacterium]
MELSAELGTTVAEGKRWAKCKKCKQTVLIVLEEKPKDSKAAFEEMRNEEVKSYSPLSSFNIGQSLYHEKWNDFGVVLSKEILSDGKKSITVEFEKLGQKKLLAN